MPCSRPARAPGRRRCRSSAAPPRRRRPVPGDLGHRRGRVEAVALVQQRVGEEARELRGVRHPTVDEVRERLRHHARRGRRGLVQHGVRRGLSGEGDQRRAGGAGSARAAPGTPPRRLRPPAGARPRRPRPPAAPPGRARPGCRHAARALRAGPPPPATRPPPRCRRWKAARALALPRDPSRRPTASGHPQHADHAGILGSAGPGSSSLVRRVEWAAGGQLRPVVMVGSPAGTPCSRSRWTAARSRCAATRSPSRSRRAARTSA